MSVCCIVYLGNVVSAKNQNLICVLAVTTGDV